MIMAKASYFCVTCVGCKEPIPLIEFNVDSYCHLPAAFLASHDEQVPGAWCGLPAGYSYLDVTRAELERINPFTPHPAFSETKR